MAQECTLTAPLTLKDTQGGVVGETGTVWTITPDCRFTVARQLGHKLLDPHKHGHLTSEQQVRLKELLDRMGESDFGIPSEPAPRVNPHRVSLSYGSRKAVLTLPTATGGAGAPHAAGGGEHEKMLVELVAAVKDMLGR